MQKIKDFFKAFIDVDILYKFKDMSIFISLLIFVAEVYLLFIPINNLLKNNIDDYAIDNSYTSALYNASSDNDDAINGIKNSNYAISENKLISSIENEESIKYELNDNVYLVFDVNGTNSQLLKDIFAAYENKFSKDDKIAYASQLVLIKMNDGVSMDEALDTYHNMTLEELTEELSKYNNKDTYGITNDEAYVVYFYNTYYLVEIYSKDSDMITIEMNYATLSLDISQMNKIDDFTKLVANAVCSYLSTNEIVMPYLYSLVICVFLFSLALALLMMLTLKNKGVMMRYVEYYNVMAILSIPVFIISFALVFIVSTKASLVYVVMFAIYTVFMLYRMSGREELR